jgi:two-component system, cell cycle response regulator DivK
LGLLLFGDVTALPNASAILLSPSTSTEQRVLLVEDNEDNRTIYSTMLRHLGYQVIEAVDGVEAVALARSEHPDIILMDISIPGIDGWEATRILREDPSTRATPIIALTAHALADDRERAAEVGFSSYLAKPIEPNAVVAEVRRLIGGDVGARTKSGG